MFEPLLLHEDNYRNACELEVSIKTDYSQKECELFGEDLEEREQLLKPSFECGIDNDEFFTELKADEFNFLNPENEVIVTQPEAILHAFDESSFKSEIESMSILEETNRPDESLFKSLIEPEIEHTPNVDASNKLEESQLISDINVSEPLEAVVNAESDEDLQAFVQMRFDASFHETQELERKENESEAEKEEELQRDLRDFLNSLLDRLVATESGSFTSQNEQAPPIKHVQSVTSMHLDDLFRVESAPDLNKTKVKTKSLQLLRLDIDFSRQPSESLQIQPIKRRRNST